MSATYVAHETVREDELNGLPLASFTRRALGFFIDFVLISVLRNVARFSWINGIPHAWERHTLVDPLHVVDLLVLIAYFAIALFIGNGKTPGKWATGIRVVSLTHPRITVWQAAERALGYGASFLELGFGFLQFFINRNRQCAHDRLAETIVVDTRRVAAPTEEAAATEKAASPEEAAATDAAVSECAADA